MFVLPSRAVKADDKDGNVPEGRAAGAAAREIRRIVLEQSKRAGVGHIGSALSIADIVAAVFTDVLRNPQPGDPDRDRFVLSKGHAALALYAALHLQGLLTAEELDSYCADDSWLGVHPEHDLPGVDFSTGSLGQGLCMAVGAALAARLQRSDRRVVALVSDAECNEGSVWEAAMFASHHRLSNLLVIVDDNAQQALGFTRDVSSVDDMCARWSAFGWDAVTVDGHDTEALTEAALRPIDGEGRPRALVAKTTFGKGVSYMEQQIKWHYLPMDDAQFAVAMSEIGA